MTLSGTAQVAAAHCPNERTLDPAVCSYYERRVAYIRATWCGVQDSVTNLHSARLEFAVYDPDSSTPLVNNVEQCTCPPQYTVKQYSQYLHSVLYNSLTTFFYRAMHFSAKRGLAIA